MLRRFALLTGFLLYTSGNVLPNSMNESVIWLNSGLGAGLLIVFVLASPGAQRLLSQPLLRQIGKISYSAYLIHMAVLLCLTPNLLKALEAFTLNRWALWFGGWLLTLTIVQLLSLLSYHCLETPSISMGKRIAGAIKATTKT
jgi:peptidoglycan/LPS O-acetylase OafA/YrhL